MRSAPSASEPEPMSKVPFVTAVVPTSTVTDPGARITAPAAISSTPAPVPLFERSTITWLEVDARSKDAPAVKRQFFIAAEALAGRFDLRAGAHAQCVVRREHDLRR